MILEMRGLRRIDGVIHTKSFMLEYSKKEQETAEEFVINYIINEEIESDYK